MFASLIIRFHVHLPIPGTRGAGGVPGRASDSPLGVLPDERRGDARAQVAAVLLATGGAVAMLGAIGVRSLRRERRGLADAFLLEQEFEELVEDTLADLYNEADPRRAIIAAYARVERIFGELRAAAGSVRGAARISRPRAADAARERRRAPPSDRPLRVGEVQRARGRSVDARRGDRRARRGPRRAPREPDRSDCRVRRRLLRGWTALLVVGAIALAAVSFYAPGRRHVALDAFVLYLGGLGLAAGVRATRAASPDVHEPSLADELDDPLDVLPERPMELERLERDVHLSLSTSFYLHYRLRPILREIASTRLLMRHGIELDERPDAAAALLGEPTWSWLQPDVEAPSDRWAPGPPLAELRAVVDTLERI